MSKIHTIIGMSCASETKEKFEWPRSRALGTCKCTSTSMLPSQRRRSNHKYLDSRPRKRKATANPRPTNGDSRVQCRPGVEDRIPHRFTRSFRIYRARFHSECLVEGRSEVSYEHARCALAESTEAQRLTTCIELDNESEKGFGLTSTQLLNSYDIISLRPTTLSTLSLACLSHTIPFALTALIISLPLTSPQALRLKHTLVRTAIKNGAVFELDYSRALEDNDSERNNWWAGGREVARVTKGKDVVVSSGTDS